MCPLRSCPGAENSRKFCNRGLTLDTLVWLLRCSVFRETPMASAIHFKKLTCYKMLREVFP